MEPASGIYRAILADFTIGRAFLVVLAGWLLYLLCLAGYRLYLSPIARFPGPKLAAITTWYQGYHDIVRGGQYIWTIKDMHSKYGPIVRINPHELHINDPEYIDQLYAGGSKRRDKYKWITRVALGDASVVSTIHHDLHKNRRAPLNPYFSKGSIRSLEPIIQEIISKMKTRLDAARTSKEVLKMRVVYKAVTADVINKYAFGKSEHHIDMADYNSTFYQVQENAARFSHVFLQFGWVMPLLESLPIAIAITAVPGLAPLFKTREEWAAQIEEIRNSKDTKTNSQDTIFHGLLGSDLLSDADKSTERLLQEAQLIIGAGLDTTATTAMAITYHLLANPPILHKLKAELTEAIPDPSVNPTSKQVEALPYLTAVIQEGIRMHPGAALRQQRVAPNEDLIYVDTAKGQKWVIPAGTPVSMTPPLIQTLPEWFPEPDTFRPERWIENPRLDRYLLSFSKGSRMCLGINLAYLELYLVLAAVFRKYDVYDESAEKQKGPTLRLYDTVRERDIDLHADFGSPWPKVQDHGLRMQVMG